MTVKPPRLVKGDKISVISPAGPVKKSRLIKGINYLKKKGYNVELGNSAEKKLGYFAGTDDERADDFNYAFKNKETKAVFCSRGGFGTVRILDKIDYEIIKNNPKILVGYSDITALSMSLLKNAGLITFSGPMVAADMDKDMDSFTEKNFWKVICKNTSIGPLKNPDSDKIVILKKGKSEGMLIGGCLSIFTKLIGTEYIPDFKNKILFLEDLNEDLYKLDFLFAQLKLTGILKEISGLILGKFHRCPPKKKKSDFFELEDIFKYYIKNLDIPVISNVAYGHIPVKLTLPVGVTVKIDTGVKNILYIKENAVI